MAIIKGVHTLDLKGLRDLYVNDGELVSESLNKSILVWDIEVVVDTIIAAGKGAIVPADMLPGNTSDVEVQYTTVYIAITIEGSDSTYIEYTPWKYNPVAGDQNRLYETFLVYANLDFGGGEEYDDRFAELFEQACPVAEGIKGPIQLKSYDFTDIECFNTLDDNSDAFVVGITNSYGLQIYKRDTPKIELNPAFGSTTTFTTLESFNTANLTLNDVVYPPKNFTEFLHKNSDTVEFVQQKFITSSDDIEQPATVAMLKEFKPEGYIEINYEVPLDTTIAGQEITDAQLSGNVSRALRLLEEGKDVRFHLYQRNEDQITDIVFSFNHNSKTSLKSPDDSTVIIGYPADSPVYMVFDVVNFTLINNHLTSPPQVSIIMTSTVPDMESYITDISIGSEADEGFDIVASRLTGDIYAYATIRPLKTITLSLEQTDNITATLPSGTRTSYSINMDYSFARAGYTLPIPTKEGFTFKGWYTTKTPANNNGAFTDITPVSGDMTLYAVFEKSRISPLKNGDTFGGAIYFDRTRNIDTWLEKIAESGANMDQLYGTDFVDERDCSIVWADVAFLANRLTGASNPLGTMGHALITCPWRDVKLGGIIYLSESVPDAVLDLFEMKHGWQIDGLVTVAGEQGTQVEALKEGVDFLYNENPNNNSSATYFQGTIRGGKKGEKTYSELLSNPRHKVCKLEFINANLSAIEWYRFQSRGASTIGAGKLAVLNYIGVSNFFSDTVDYIKILSTGEEQEGHVPLISLYGVSMNLNKSNELTTTVSSFDGDLSRSVEGSINLSPLINYTSDVPTTTTVGGIEEGSTFNNVSIQSILDDLLHPYVAPTINSITLNPINGGTFVKNSTAEIAITGAAVYITKGSAAITGVKLFDGDTPLELDSESTPDFSRSPVELNLKSPILIQTSLDSKSLTVSVKDGKDRIYTKDSAIFSFVYSYYYTTAQLDSPIEESWITANCTELVEGQGTKRITYNPQDQNIIFISPYRVTKIEDPNKFVITDTFNETQNIIVNGWNYYAYVSKNRATATNFTLTFYN